MLLNLPTLLVSLLGVSPQGPPETADRPLPLPPPRIVVLPRGTKEITIDGSLADWPGLPPIGLDDQRQLSGTAANAWRGDKDLSAVAFLVWDADSLYVACVVKDEWHRALDAKTLTLTEVPVADSVVLTFDPNRDTRSIGPDPGRREDREFWLADQAGRQIVQWDRLRGTAQVIEDAKARCVALHDKERGITTYEASMPWSEILPAGAKAAPGRVFDMQIVVNDFDESTDPMPQTRIGWTFGSGPVIDPAGFGSVMLVDADAATKALPAFPERPVVETPGLDPKEWEALTQRLLQVPPAIYDGTKAPAEAGGLARLKVLEEIEGHCEAFPRVDFVELQHRIHRRMQREVAGIERRGLPSWWHERLAAMSKNAEDPVPNATVRLFRLPMGGWLVRMTQGGFLIDAAGAGVAEYLWGGAQFCVLTQPLDMTRRNDQLLLRMLQTKPPRPVFMHIAFHLPVVAMTDVPLFEPGQKFAPTAGVEVRALGAKLADGSVPWSCSYVVAVPAGPRLLVVGPNLLPDEAADVGAIDAMILSPRNPEAPAIVKKVAPRLVVVDDGFLPAAYPDQKRMALRTLHSLQGILRPQPSLILAPGESWDIAVAPK